MRRHGGALLSEKLHAVICLRRIDGQLDSVEWPPQPEVEQGRFVVLIFPSGSVRKTDLLIMPYFED
jgi:hypothetical protein